MRPVRGFTLVEVLVALMVMSLIAAMAWQGVDGMLRTRDAGQSRMDATLRLATVLAQWEQDLSATRASPAVPAVQFDGASMRLLRSSGDGQQIVVWTVRDGRWQRWASPVALRNDELQQHWLASQQLQGREPGQLTMQEGVAGWQVYFYRGNAWSNAQSSADLVVDSVAPPTTAPSAPAGASAPTGDPRAALRAPTQQVALPSAVRLVLHMADGEGRSLTRDIRLAPQTP